jgi:NADPH:quinone reductase-like Zn-dependent oxidoreductase
MRAIVVREYGTAPVVSEVAEPDGEPGEVLAASLNPVDVSVAKGLIPFRRPVPYGALAERVPLAGTETVPLPAGLDPVLAAAVVSVSGLARVTTKIIIKPNEAHDRPCPRRRSAGNHRPLTGGS